MKAFEEWLEWEYSQGMEDILKRKTSQGYKNLKRQPVLNTALEVVEETLEPELRSHVSRQMYPNIREDLHVGPDQSRIVQRRRKASCPMQNSYRASIQRTTNPKDKSIFEQTNRKEQRSGFDSKVKEISDEIQSISLNDQTFS